MVAGHVDDRQAMRAVLFTDIPTQERIEVELTYTASASIYTLPAELNAVRFERGLF